MLPASRDGIWKFSNGPSPFAPLARGQAETTEAENPASSDGDIDEKLKRPFNEERSVRKRRA
jgi:hypothetical protein